MIYKERTYEILLAIYHNTLTQKELASQFGVTTRTVRADIDQIKYIIEDNAEVVYKKNVGYSLTVHNKQFVSDLLSKQPCDLLDDVVLLLLKNKQTNIRVIEESFFISRSKANLLIKQTKTLLTSFKLKLFFVNKAFFIDGSETDKRLLIINILSKHQMYLHRLEQDYNVKYLDIFNVCQRVFCNKTEKFLQALVNMTFVMLCRINKGFVTYEANKPTQELTNALFIELKKHDFYFSVNEMFLIDNFFSGTACKNKYSVEVLLNELLLYIFDNYNYDLRNNQRLKKELIKHMNDMFIRIENSIFCPNRIVLDIKNNYSFSFWLLTEFFRNKLISIDENEISYLAIHIGFAIDEITINKTCKIYLNIEPQSIKKFTEQILCNNFSKIKFVQTKQESDLIVVNQNLETNKPKITISAPPTSNELNLIRNFLNSFQKKLILNYFSKSNFEYLNSFNNKTELLNKIIERLVAKKIVNADFKQKIFERENILSTYLDGCIAIPHAIDFNANRSEIYTVILQKPIIWDAEGNLVNIVFMLAINRKDYQDICDIYHVFATLVKNKSYKKITALNNFDNFIKHLENHCND